MLIEPDGTVLAEAARHRRIPRRGLSRQAAARHQPARPRRGAPARRLVRRQDEPRGHRESRRREDDEALPRLRPAQLERDPRGQANLGYHLDYIGYLVERRRWLAGDHFSLADITAAAHLSALDYLGDVPWDSTRPPRSGMRGSSRGRASAPSSPTTSRARRRPSTTPISISEAPRVSAAWASVRPSRRDAAHRSSGEVGC